MLVQFNVFRLIIAWRNISKKSWNWRDFRSHKNVISSWESSFDFDEIIHSGEFWRCIESWSRNTLNAEKWTIFNGCWVVDRVRWCWKKKKLKLKIDLNDPKFWIMCETRVFLRTPKCSQWDDSRLRRLQEIPEINENYKTFQLYCLNHDTPHTKYSNRVSQVVVFRSHAALRFENFLWMS